MPTPVVRDLTAQLLNFSTQASYRDSLSNYFVPIPLPVEDGQGPYLTAIQTVALLNFYIVAGSKYLPPDQPVINEVAAILQANGLRATADALAERYASGAEATHHASRARLHAPDAEVAHPHAGIGAFLNPKLVPDARTDGLIDAFDKATAYYADPHTDDAGRAARRAEVDFARLKEALKSEIGWLFLDRTRMTPAGFAVGEHVYSLSLSPGEERVLEQKIYSKRTVTYETQDEQELQIDLELSSTFTSELQEGLDEQFNKNSTNGQGLGALTGADAKVNLFNIVEFEKFKTTEADNETRRTSTKKSSTATGKVASKYRSLHKIQFKSTTEVGFETTSKIVIKNPSRFTPMQYHYFKVLQKVDVRQERYGARLCWAPYLEDPGRELFRRISEGRAAVIRDSLAAAKTPGEPQPPTRRQLPVLLQQGSARVTGWNPDRGINTFVNVFVPVPAAYRRDPSFPARVFFTAGFAASRVLTCTATSVDQVGNQIRVQVSVIVSNVGPENWHRGDLADMTVHAELRFLPNPENADPAIQTEMDTWEKAHREWEQLVAGANRQAKLEAETKANQWVDQQLAAVNPINEMMSTLIGRRIDHSLRDEAWEIELWTSVFDWEGSAYRLYPGWWNAGPLRFPALHPAHLINASWARLYLPVNIGAEALALRLIYPKLSDTALERARDKKFAELITEITDYRAANFGQGEIEITATDGCPSAVEKVICLGAWSEFLPTDGTHVEVVQSESTAADGYAAKDLEDTKKLRDEQLESEKADVELKRQALTLMTEPASVQVLIQPDLSAQTTED